MSTVSISPLSTEWSMRALADKDPFPIYDNLRKRGDVIWDPGMNCWLVLSYDICKVIESDENTFGITHVKDAPPFWFEINGGRTAVSSLIGEEHARMRRLYLKLLSPAATAQCREEHVLPVINDAVDRFEKHGQAELTTQLSDPLPTRVMASMFGLPWKDDKLIADVTLWHRDIVAWLYNNTNEALTTKAKLASDELTNLFLPLVIERKEKRGTDLISQIWSRAPEDWGNVGVDDVIAIAREMAIGAGETTTNAIANAIYLYLTNPSVREAVTNDQIGALNTFVEEILRLLGAIQFRFRQANRDINLGGVSIKKDQTICMLHAAANRDPTHYKCPHAIDLNRKPATDHVAFNVGPRICPGMHLARLKIRECLKVLMVRLPDLRLDPTKEAPRFHGFSHRSFGPLHVRF
ncbi:cytochrome P450 [Mesorhizobium sp. M0520]|uniref:cytochrome P450 n=1 Tax=Mesorhizobium sp. M0520 TaxID=2956957 RepID=UPI00333CBED9